MTAHSFEQTSEITEQAIAWFMRLRADDISDEDQEAYAEWLLSDPGHVDAYAQVEANWGTLAASRTTVLQNYANETADLTRQAHNPNVWRFGWETLLGTRPVLRNVLVGTAALMLLLITGLTVSSLSTGPTTRQLLQTAAGELNTVTLADGSIVDLDADTQMTFLSNRKMRTIELHQGAAVFDVAQNSRQPFTVAAGETTFTAVGTVFEVSFRDNMSMITMQEGVVKARRGELDASSYRLNSGDRLVFAGDSSVPVRSTVSPDQIGLWHQRQSVFEQQPLSSVVKHLNRYFSNGQLHIADSHTGEMLFSGVIQLDSEPEIIAERLVGLLPIQYSVTGEHITLYADAGR